MLSRGGGDKREEEEGEGEEIRVIDMKKGKNMNRKG